MSEIKSRREHLTLKAGRELDALIAEKVMGLRRHDPEPDASDLSWERIDDPYESFELPHYSTDIAAWEIVEKLGNMGWKVAICNDKKHPYTPVLVQAKPRSQNLIEVIIDSAKTVPHAICLAALAAVEGEGK